MQMSTAQSTAQDAVYLVAQSGLNAIAEHCHRLAVARGKYPWHWSVQKGYGQIVRELDEWYEVAESPDETAAAREYGDLLHAVLSVGAHMGYDIEACLRDAIRRNAERAKEGV